ncbi:precorrin-6y C5,15-methyltransferase (decarboxylating) subunit CbiE [Natronincola ferrireducens]|uniref:Precorrin-6Y C5,15-methyltransferase (Decarboxylating) n=1 Tax=Natronincola ferrireducens TaxID=393762 RepID=A0A1G8WRT8_9FIRM|nr:precorrin-6y C5,15-methyltransferase (decarboxylating) subunit CbiE [Natronincola ferrireducens]SDJ80984.1 precorrin-6Y C5,15-methyltransferase (decarboxylating) [Natronincola ferrireducens]
MNKIIVAGIGPGHRDYVLPAVYRAVENSDILIGGKRNLEIFQDFTGETHPITRDLEEVISYIKDKRRDKKITFVVSGDTGFYSMLTYLKRHFSKEDLEVIPGITSLQYLFSKMKEPWQEVPLMSLHGRQQDFLEKLQTFKKVAMLTDNIYTPDRIAEILIKAGLKSTRMTVGENLSYRDERIIEGRPQEIIGAAPYKMAVVVIQYE